MPVTYNMHRAFSLNHPTENARKGKLEPESNFVAPRVSVKVAT